MSMQVDEKVVKMQFDNANFEANVKQSMSTLEKLKSALSNIGGKNNAFNDIESSARNVNLNPLQASAEAVGQKFTALETIATGALLKIGSQAVTVGENLVKSLSVDQISAGYAKYEQKTQNVQTLLNSTGKTIEEVNGYLDELMWYSDETSFGFTDMTSALATMTSTGGDIEKLIPMIEGIGNATAYAGKGAAEFSRVIFNLNQSYSQGFLSTMDWRSVQGAGAASKQLQEFLIQAAEETGTIKKNTGDIKEFATYLTKKQISSEAMEIAFTRFASYTQAIKEAVDNGTYETATEAMEHMSTDGFDTVAVSAMESAQQAKSFSEAIDATKDAVSSSFMRIIESFFGGFDEATETWTMFCEDLWDIFAEPLERKTNFLGDLLGEPVDRFRQELSKAGVEYEDFENALVSVGKDHNVKIDGYIKYYGSLDEALKSGKISAEYISQALFKLATNTKDTALEAEGLTTKISNFNSIIEDVRKGAYGNGTERIKALEEAGYEYAKVQDLVNRAIRGEKIEIQNLSAAELESIGYTADEIDKITRLAAAADKAGTPINELINKLSKPTGRELFIDSLHNILLTLKGTIESVKEAWSDIFPSQSVDQWYNILEAINEFTAKIRDSVTESDRMTRTFKGAFAILDMGRKIFMAILNPIIAFCNEMGFMNVSILDATASLGDWLVAIDNSSEFMEVLQKISEKTSKVIKTLAKTITNYIPNMINAYNEAGGGVKGIISTLTETATELSVTLVEIVENITGLDLGNWKNAIKSALTTVKNSVIEFGRAIKSHLPDNGKVFDEFGETINKIKPYFGDLKDAFLKADFDKIGETFKKIEDEIKKSLGKETLDVIDRLKKAFTDFKAKIGEIFEALKNKDAKGLKESFQELVDIFTNFNDSGVPSFFEKLSAKATEAKNSIKEFGEFVKSVLASVDWEKVEVISFCIALIYSLNKLKKAITEIENVASPFLALINTVKGTFSALSGAIKAWKHNIQSKTILTIAISIGILVGALALLSSPLIDQERLKNAAFVMEGLIAVLAAFTIAMGFVKNPSGFLTEAAMIVALAGGIFLAVEAIAKLNGIDVKASTVWALIGIFVALAAVGTAISYATGKFKGLGTAANIIALAAACYIVSLSLEKINEAMKDPDQTKRTLESLIVILGMLALCGLAMSFAGGGSGFSILAVVASLYLLELALKKIVTDGVKIEEIKAHLEEFGVLFGAIIAVALAARLAGSKTKGAAASILAVTISLGLLLYIVKKANELKPDEVKRGAIIVGGVSAILDVLMLCSEKTRNVKPGTIIALTIMIVAIVAALAVLTMIDMGEVLVSAIALSTVLWTLSKTFSSMKGVAKGKVGVILSMVGMVAVIAAGLAAIAYFGQSSGRILASALALDMVLAAVAGCMYTITNLMKGGEKSLKPKLALFGEMIGALIVIGASLAVIAYFGQSAGQILASALALDMVLVAVAGCMVIIGKTKATMTLAQAGEFILMIAAIVAIGWALGQLADHPWESILSAATSVSLVLVAVSAAMLICSVIGTAAVPALIGLGVVVAALAVLAGVIAAISALATPNNIAAVERGGLLLEAVGQMFGKAITGFLEGITSGLPKIGEYIGKFAENSKPLFDTLSSLDPKVPDAAKALAAALLAITAADLIQGLMDFLHLGGIDNLSEDLKALGAGVSGFYKVTKDIAGTDFNTIANGTKTLIQTLADLPPNGGLLGWILGKDVGNFGLGMQQFAQGIKDFYDVLAPTDLTQILTGIPVIKRLIETLSELPTNGGFLGWVLGKDLSNFANGMINLASAIANFAYRMKYAELDTLLRSCSVISSLFHTLNEVPCVSGLWPMLKGNNLELFSGNLEEFGVAIHNYAKHIRLAYLNKKEIEEMNQPITNLFNCFKNIPEINGGLLGLIFGNDLKDFANGIGDLGEGLNIFAKNVIGIDPEKVVAAGRAASSLMNSLRNVPELDGGLIGAIFGNDLKDFAKGIASLGSGIADFYESVGTSVSLEDCQGAIDLARELITLVNDFINTDAAGAVENLTQINQFINTLALMDFSSLTTTMNQLGVDVVNGFSTGITNSADIIKVAADTLFYTFSSAVRENKFLMEALVEKIKECLGGFTSAEVVAFSRTKVENFVTNIVSAIKTKKEEFTRAGVFCAKAFGDGLCNKEAKDGIKSSLNSLVNECVKVLQNGGGGEDENGNKKDGNGKGLWYEAGANAIQGFIDGMDSKMGEVKKKAKEIAQAAYSEAMAALDEHSPSRVFRQIGAYVDEGFILGMDDKQSEVSETAGNLGLSVIQSTKDALTAGLSSIFDESINPVITPELDLSNVYEGARLVNASFGKTKIGAEVTDPNAQNGGKENNVTFVQNNYSPKALSRVEIYRQTNNQISMLKGAMAR